MSDTRQTLLTYFLLPGLVLPILCWLAYTVLSLPVGWVLVPGSLGLTWWYRDHWRHSHRVEHGDRYNVIIVGAGMSGLCTGARLKQAGVTFTIFEAG